MTTADKAALDKTPMSLKTVTQGDFTWIDITQPTREATTKYLTEHYNFNPLDIEDALSQRQVPKIEEYPDYLFIVFHLSVYDKANQISSRKQWSAFVGSNFLVTIHPTDFQVATDIFHQCEVREDAREQFLNRGSGFLLYQLLDEAIDRYFRVLDKILSLIDSIEDKVFSEKVEVAAELSFLRRDIIIQRQVMFPTRTLLSVLEKKLKEFTKTDLTLYFSDLMDHVNKVCDTLDEYTEAIDVFKDTDYLLSGYRANRTIRMMAMIVAISMPILVVAGFSLMMPGGPSKVTMPTFVALLLVIAFLISGTLYFLRRRHLI